MVALQSWVIGVQIEAFNLELADKYLFSVTEGAVDFCPPNYNQMLNYFTCPAEHAPITTCTDNYPYYTRWLFRWLSRCLFTVHLSFKGFNRRLDRVWTRVGTRFWQSVPIKLGISLTEGDGTERGISSKSGISEKQNHHLEMIFRYYRFKNWWFRYFIEWR